jgi:hypothetical protein
MKDFYMRCRHAGDSIWNLHVDPALLHADQRRGPAVEEDLRLRQHDVENPASSVGSRYRGVRAYALGEDRQELARRHWALAKRGCVQKSYRGQLCDRSG